MLSFRTMALLLTSVMLSVNWMGDINSDLFKAIGNGEVAAVEALLAKGADVNAKRGQGETGLMIAAWNGDTSMTSLLLTRGANVNAKTSRGETALVYSCWNGHLAIIKTLLDRQAEVNVADQDGNSPLMLVSFYGYTEVVRSLIDKGAEVNAKNSQGETALMWAAKAGQAAIIEILQSKGVDVNGRTKQKGSIILFYLPGNFERLGGATLQGGQSVLYDLKNDRPLPSRHSKSPFEQKASRYFYVEMLGNPTALHMAALTGHAEGVRALLAHGADVNAKTDNGWTALAMVVSKGESIFEYIHPFYRGPIQYLRSMQTQYREVADTLLSSGADVGLKLDGDMFFEKGQTLLHFAAKTGEAGVAKALLARGADINAKSGADWTALMIAVFYGKTDVVKTLLEARADVAVKNKKGWTALEMAQKHHWDKEGAKAGPEIAKLLRESGAKE